MFIGWSVIPFISLLAMLCVDGPYLEISHILKVYFRSSSYFYICMKLSDWSSTLI